MMDHLTLDPYERQLLTVFDSYDHENRGSLDRDGLTQLCQTLQLEEQGTDLITCLLKDPKHSRATFTEFKDALLALLGKMQNNKSNKTNDEVLKKNDGSPDREVSPKFVYGSKKYGRRSRPKNEEITQIFDEQNDINYLNKTTTTSTNTVQRSNSQIEVSNSKKRKTNYKLKRCTSLPGHHDFETTNQRNFITSHSLTSEPEFVCTEEMLREAWKKLGVGKDGYLNQTELVLVCDAIGLHKLAKGVIRQLSAKLTLDYDHKISFQELLEALQQDDAWSDVLNSTPITNNEETLSLSHTTTNEIFPDSHTFQYITLGPNGNGIINFETIIEMWETVGITQPKELLIELGFNCQQISIVDLAQVLEKEIKGLQDNNTTTPIEFHSNPHIVLLHANLTLYQLEIRCLKNIIEQMHAEREKLKGDVIEANNRATLLAQEVDDNHSRMERNTLNQVKLIEQRHNDILKELQQQYGNDKEQLSLINQNLEDKIQLLEQETNKLKNDLILAQKYSTSLEKENQLLTGQINELQQIKLLLNEQITNLENDKQKFSEMEHKQIEPLLTKLNELQIENSQLRDRNDEMVTEIENLTKQVTTMRTKVANTPTYTLDQSMDDDDDDDVDDDDDGNNISFICEGVGLGAKRRSNYSPTKDNNLFGLADGSPRLGKLRKCHKNKAHLDVPYTSNESGFDTEIDCCDSSLTSNSGNNNDCEEITRLQAKIVFLEQLLTQHAIAIPTNNSLDTRSASSSSSSSVNIIQLKQRIVELETIIKDVKKEVTKMITKNGLNCDNLHRINDKLVKIFHNDQETSSVDDVDDNIGEMKKVFVDASVETDKFFEEEIKKYEEENKELTIKCNELENCVELLRNEYERCEDYWQSKLDEERQMFEQEQNQNSEKLTDLISKMAEYEEQFNNQDLTDNRLPTIEETYNLEKQFTDLEQEFEDYKQQSENELYQKDEEITILKQKLTELALEKCKNEEIGIQVDEINEKTRIDNKMNNLSLCVVESTNLFSADAMPIQWEQQHHQQQEEESIIINEKSIETNTQLNSAFVWNKGSQTDIKTKESDVDNNSLIWQNNSKSQPSSLTNLPSTSSSSTLEKNSTPCRPKRTRKHERNSLLYKKNNQEKDINNKKSDDINQLGWKNGFHQNYKTNDEQQQQVVALPVTTIHNLNGRLHHLEQRCRQLQMVLKQQHFYTEQTLQQCWQHHQGEKAELQCILRNHQEKLDHQVRVCNEQLERLARSDMLVKELYVENSYLIAKVQRLEHQCHMLVQCTSNCSSV